MKLIPRHILVPTDLSFEADQALAHALHLARLFEADVHLLHALGTPGGDAPTARDIERVHERMELAASRRLEHDSNGVEARGAMLHTRVIQGMSVVPAVLAYSSRAGIDLIVMGTRGRQAPERPAWQSQAEEIARTASCPVLTVGRNVRSYPDKVRRILLPVALDGVTTSAIATGRLIAAREGAELDLLHVVHTKPLNGVNAGGGLHHSDIVNRVEKLYRGSTGPDVRRRIHVRYGDPAQVVSSFATEHNSHLVVITTRGTQGVDFALTGSLAASVIGTAPCPVLTLKQDAVAGALTAIPPQATAGRLSYT